MALSSSLPVLRAAGMGSAEVGALVSLTGVANSVGKVMHGALAAQVAPRSALVWVLTAAAALSYTASASGEHFIASVTHGMHSSRGLATAILSCYSAATTFCLPASPRSPGHAARVWHPHSFHLRPAPGHLRPVAVRHAHGPAMVRAGSLPEAAGRHRLRLPHRFFRGLVRLRRPPHARLPVAVGLPHRRWGGGAGRGRHRHRPPTIARPRRPPRACPARAQR